MTVNLETIGEEYRQRVCQGMNDGLEDKLVVTELAKKTKGWRKLPDGAVAIEERIYVPRDEQLRQEIIWEHHDDRAAGHPGRYKTQELITRNYWWPMISRDVKSYVGGVRHARGQRSFMNQVMPPYIHTPYQRLHRRRYQWIW
jgi:hypothetical protein